MMLSYSVFVCTRITLMQSKRLEMGKIIKCEILIGLKCAGNMSGITL